MTLRAPNVLVLELLVHVPALELGPGRLLGVVLQVLLQSVDVTELDLGNSVVLVCAVLVGRVEGHERVDVLYCLADVFLRFCNLFPFKFLLA